MILRCRLPLAFPVGQPVVSEPHLAQGRAGEQTPAAKRPRHPSQFGSAITYLFELAPPHRKGVVASLGQAAIAPGIGLGILVVQILYYTCPEGPHARAGVRAGRVDAVRCGFSLGAGCCAAIAQGLGILVVQILYYTCPEGALSRARVQMVTACCIESRAQGVLPRCRHDRAYVEEASRARAPGDAAAITTSDPPPKRPQTI